jgi:SAM-dependent methyltransferase
MIKRVLIKIKVSGFKGLIKAINRNLFPNKIKYYDTIKDIVSMGSGLEIGGVSGIFKDRGSIPIYKHINNLDNCNFSESTVWENISKEYQYKYHKSKNTGTQYILEATNLESIDDEKYDFILSSNMIEHTGNVIKAINEWLRVIKDNGYLILVIPHKDGTFDHQRSTTKLEHFIKDYENDVDENDLTHLDEILENHDLKLDPGAGSFEEFKKRSYLNHKNRCLHHHTFTSKSIAQLMDYLNLDIKVIEPIEPQEVVVVLKKSTNNTAIDNKDILDLVSSNRFQSPFKSDNKFKEK